MSVRFAPSPTGRFHLGNFRTAWISHEIARRLGLRWIVRFEDIDQPRVVPGAQDLQLQEMAALGLKPDEIVVQSRSFPRHWEVFEKAVRLRKVYPCFCSRKELREALELDRAASAPHAAPVIYSGRCRSLECAPQDYVNPTLAWRLASQPEDGSQDIIIARSEPGLGSDGLPRVEGFVPAYNWACAIDDADGDYDLLVRSWDLDHVADPQRQIQKLVYELEGRAPKHPVVFHTSLVVQEDGHRLEKRTRGVTLEELKSAGWDPARLLRAFEQSFEVPAKEIVPRKTSGESKRQIRVSELLKTE